MPREVLTPNGFIRIDLTVANRLRLQSRHLPQAVLHVLRREDHYRRYRCIRQGAGIVVASEGASYSRARSCSARLQPSALRTLHNRRNSHNASA
jgi:hypothetical protein